MLDLLWDGISQVWSTISKFSDVREKDRPDEGIGRSSFACK
jgi:hypothetical protein